MYMPTHVILVLIASSSNGGSDESAHVRRLLRAFVARMAHKVWIGLVEDLDQTLHCQPRLVSDQSKEQ